MIKLRYNVQKAESCGIQSHPQVDMHDLGYAPIRSTPAPSYGCWIFEVSEIIQPLPPYLEEIKL